MTKASLIFKRDLAPYTVSRLDSLTSSPAGEQIQNRSDHNLDLAVYDQGQKVVKKLNEDSYTISTIRIHSEPNALKLLDEVPFKGLAHTVIEEKNRSDHSIYKAVCNV